MVTHVVTQQHCPYRSKRTYRQYRANHWAEQHTKRYRSRGIAKRTCQIQTRGDSNTDSPNRAIVLTIIPNEANNSGRTGGKLWWQRREYRANEIGGIDNVRMPAADEGRIACRSSERLSRTPRRHQAVTHQCKKPCRQGCAKAHR